MKINDKSARKAGNMLMMLLSGILASGVSMPSVVDAVQPVSTFCETHKNKDGTYTEACKAQIKRMCEKAGDKAGRRPLCRFADNNSSNNGSNSPTTQPRASTSTNNDSKATYNNYTKLSREKGTSRSFSGVNSQYLIYNESYGRDGHKNIDKDNNSDKAPKIDGATLLNLGGGQDKFIALYKINSSNITVHVTGGAAGVLFLQTNKTVTLKNAKSVDPELDSGSVIGPANSNEVVIYAEDEGGKAWGDKIRDDFFKPKASHTFGSGDDLLYIFKFGSLSPQNNQGPGGNGAVGTLVFK